jgi:putative Mn2+ efflux pump MntP
MLTTIIVLIILFLSIQVFPVAIGINIKGNWLKATLFVVVLSLLQAVTYWLGLKLGSTFMHLMDGFKGVVFLLGFLLIGIRMLMETLSIRKGERTYSIDSVGFVVMASLAQSMNTFLAGLLFNYIDVNEIFTVILLLVLTVIIAVVGVILKPEKQSLIFASLLYTLGGITMIISSIYITFFIF